MISNQNQNHALKTDLKSRSKSSFCKWFQIKSFCKWTEIIKIILFIFQPNSCQIQCFIYRK